MQPVAIASAAVAFVATLLASPPLSAAQVAVTACEQVVDGLGYLTGDLDCTGFVYAVLVRPRGSLDLRGFTITGGQDGVNCGDTYVDELGQQILLVHGAV